MNGTEGGCLCGAVRFRVTDTPLSSIICHCRTCRRASGAPSVAWLTVARSDFTVLSGVPTEFTSSAGVTRSFCSICGTPLTYKSDQNPDIIDVTTVSLDDPSLVPPTREVWLEHKLSWEATNRALDQYPGGSSDGSYSSSI